jgi:hypothetical protein
MVKIKTIMKNFKLLLLFVFVASISCAQQKASPRKEAKGTLNKVSVTIDYGSPSVKGRAVWESLVPSGEVWRAGANENTTVTFDNDVTIGGGNLKAGKYGLFIIPNKDSDWVVIFNSKNDSWGSNGYSKELDVIRVKISPTFVDDNQEGLMYAVGKGSIDFAWEKARLSIPVSTK